MHGDFRDSIGTSTMVGAGHNCFGTERRHGVFDALVFGGDDYARCAGGFAQAFDDVLDHGAAGYLGQGLAGEAN
jgi:hypothetical protein